MSDELKNDEVKERQAMYDRCRDDLLKRHLSNAENFDRAILTYSSAGLAISLTFIQKLPSFSQADFCWTLYVSWVCFVLAIILTIISYPIGQKAVDTQLKYAEKYYLKNKREAFNAPNSHAEWVERLGLGSGISFIFAVILTTTFVCLNIH